MVTENEHKLIKMAKKLRNDVDYAYCIVYLGRQKNRTDDIIEYIETHPEASSDDVFEFAIRATAKTE